MNTHTQTPPPGLTHLQVSPTSRSHPPPGLTHLQVSPTSMKPVKKVLYFSDSNTPRASRAHPADRVTDNIESVFRPKWKRVKTATNFTEAL